MKKLTETVLSIINRKQIKEYSKFPDMTPRGIAKSIIPLERNFNKDMEHLYSNIRKINM